MKNNFIYCFAQKKRGKRKGKVAKKNRIKKGRKKEKMEKMGRRKKKKKLFDNHFSSQIWHIFCFEKRNRW